MKMLPKRIDLFIQLKPGAIGAEIGVWRGYLSVEIMQRSRVRKLYLVDAWKPQPSYNDPLTDTDHEANLAETKHHLRGFQGRWEIVRGTSVEVAANDKTIPPLDFCYVDADHSYEACLADLKAWEKRLKPTGVLMGHDYTNNDQAKKWNFGVIPAVNDFCRDHGWKITYLTNEDFASYQLERK
jgi:predicted O-methyltransferase YrrM